MKKLIMVSIFLGVFSISFAQTGPSFSKSQQAKIRKVLGKEFNPIYNSNGELVITKTGSVSTVKALPGGGFSNLSKNGSVAKNELIHKGWIYKNSKEALESMKTKLGQERFKQLNQILSSPKKGVSFPKSKQVEISKILGNDFKPVFNSYGELVITKTGSVSTVKALPGGGFSNLSKNSSVAKNELIHKGWIYKNSKEALESMKTKLGQERFNQLEAILITE